MRRRFINNIGADVIYYTSTDASIISPVKNSLGTSVVSNTYGKTGGKIVCRGKVIIIGTGAFSLQSTLKTITIPRNVIEISGNAFYGCNNLTTMTIPDSVTSIGNFAFTNCSKLTSITIPESVTFIGKNAFSGCSSLTSISIPNGVASIENNTFYGCRSLTSITIPDSVSKIGEKAFYDCLNLLSVYCKATTPPTLGGNYVFVSNVSGRKIYVPSGSVDAYRVAEGWSKYADDILPWDVENDKTDGSPITLSYYRYYPKVTQYLMNKYGLSYGTKSNPLPIEEKIILSDSFSSSLGDSLGEVLYISTASSWDQSFGIRLYLGDHMSTFTCVALETYGTNPGFGCARSNFYD